MLSQSMIDAMVLEYCTCNQPVLTQDEAEVLESMGYIHSCYVPRLVNYRLSFALTQKGREFVESVVKERGLMLLGEEEIFKHGKTRIVFEWNYYYQHYELSVLDGDYSVWQQLPCSTDRTEWAYSGFESSMPSVNEDIYDRYGKVLCLV